MPMNNDKSETVVTSDLSAFGWKELNEASELLKALCEEHPDFLGNGLTLNLNKNSGFVFLSDEEYNVGMLNYGKIEQWFNCPECGHEGFKEDMHHEGNEECKNYLKEIGLK